MKADADKLKLFTGRANPELAQRICDYLEIPMGRGRTELFPDGELIVKVEEDVRGRDCFIVQPTCHPGAGYYLPWVQQISRWSVDISPNSSSRKTQHAIYLLERLCLSLNRKRAAPLAKS